MDYIESQKLNILNSGLRNDKLYYLSYDPNRIPEADFKHEFTQSSTEQEDSVNYDQLISPKFISPYNKKDQLMKVIIFEFLDCY